MFKGSLGFVRNKLVFGKLVLGLMWLCIIFFYLVKLVLIGKSNIFRIKKSCAYIFCL